MKKYIILLLPILVLLFGSVSFAYSQADVNNLRTTFYNQYGVTLNETYAQQLVTFWDINHSECPFLAMQKTSTNKYAFIVADSRPDGSNGLQWGFYGYKTSDVIDPTTQTTLTWAISSPAQMLLTKAGNLKIGPWQQWHQIDIDYSQIFFDPSVPYPDFTTQSENVVLDLTSQGLGTVHGKVPKWHFYDNYHDYPERLYLYMSLKFWTPSGYEIKIIDGFVNWKPTGSLIASDTDYPVPYTDLEILTAGQYEIGMATYKSGLMMNLFNSFISTVTPTFTGDTESTFHYSDSTSTVVDNTLGTKAYRHLPLESGNRLSMKCCYYYIKNGHLYCGLWTTWDSIAPNDYNVAKLNNDNFQFNYNTANVMPEQGEQQEESDIPPVNIPDQGTNITVNVNNGEQGVPNNMNYPTVVSYNHDNIFTTFVSTYNSAGQYLGDFGNFVQATFAWIPGQVWTLIIMGFGMALVIMILKII